MKGRFVPNGAYTTFTGSATDPRPVDYGSGGGSRSRGLTCGGNFRFHHSGLSGNSAGILLSALTVQFDLRYRLLVHVLKRPAEKLYRALPLGLDDLI